MNVLTRSIWLGLILASLTVGPAAAAPAAQSVSIDVAPPRVQIFPLGTARVQTVLSNPTSEEQVFALEILMVRSDGTLVTAYLSDALALAAGTSAPAIYSIRHADGAVEAVIIPRPCPELAP